MYQGLNKSYLECKSKYSQIKDKYGKTSLLVLLTKPLIDNTYNKIDQCCDKPIVFICYTCYSTNIQTLKHYPILKVKSMAWKMLYVLSSYELYYRGILIFSNLLHLL